MNVFIFFVFSSFSVSFGNNAYYEFCMNAENAIIKEQIEYANKMYKKAFKIEVPLARDFSNFLKLNDYIKNKKNIEFAIKKYGKYFNSDFFRIHLSDSFYSFYLSKQIKMDSSYFKIYDKIHFIFENDQAIRKESEKFTQNKYKDSIFAKRIRSIDSMNLVLIHEEIFVQKNYLFLKILSSDHLYSLLIGHYLMYDNPQDSFFINKMTNLIAHSKNIIVDKKRIITSIEKSEYYASFFNTGYTYFIFNDTLCLSFNINKLLKTTIEKNRKIHYLESFDAFREKIKWQLSYKNKARLNFVTVNLAYVDKEILENMLNSDLNDSFYLGTPK